MKKIKNVISKIIVRILWYFPPKLAHKILYRMVMKEKLNIDKPKTLNEKTQYIIANKLLKEKETKCTDKYLMREYVEEKGYKDNLPKIYGIYKNANEIDMEKLPEKFVLKTNNGSGDIFICKNKEKFIKEQANFKKILNKNLKKNYARKALEYHYSNIKPLIICEEFLDDNSGKTPIDYKFWCFNGKAKYVLVCLDRETHVKKVYYDTQWNYLEDFSTYKHNKIDKPEKLEEMIKIAEKLASDFNMVRVDLYNIRGKIYVGELTFTSDSGMCQYLTPKAQKILGDCIELKK